MQVRKQKMNQIRRIFILIHPIEILLCLLAFWMGWGLANYLGATLRPIPQLVGGASVALFFASSNLLTEYFRTPGEQIIWGDTKADREFTRFFILFVGVSFIALAGVLLFILNQSGYLKIETIIVLTLFILLGIANAVPPIRFANRSLSELSSAFLIASLSPTLAFLLQFGSFHRLLTLFTIPLVLLTVSYFITSNFRTYSEDLKYRRKSLLIGLTWQRAVYVHNAILLLAYLFIAAIPFFGVPFSLVWPALLTLPLAVFHVYQIRRLAEGAKPFWAIIISTATAILGLTTYLIALTFWMN